MNNILRHVFIFACGALALAVVVWAAYHIGGFIVSAPSHPMQTKEIYVILRVMTGAAAIGVAYGLGKVIEDLW